MSSEQSFVDAGLRSWRLNMDRATKFFDSLAPAELETEVGPSRNRFIYIWGHLTAVNDATLPLFALGPKRFPELEALFIKQPDRAVSEIPSGADLKEMWTQVDASLWNEFQKLSPSEWLERHQAISEEDFVREPYRHRYSSLLGKTAHVAYHLGQMIIARPK